MNRTLLSVQHVCKRLCTRPDKALSYALADIGRDVFGVGSHHRLRPGEFWALDDVSLRIQPGEVVGIIGQNGAGKSTLIKIISGIIKPTSGRVSLGTDKVVLIDSHGGLNPVQTGRENALAQLVLHALPEECLGNEIEIVKSFADIGDFFDAPVGTYSLGMRLRLAFAIYSRLKPDLFIIDEALGGGDEQFRSKFRNYLRHYIDSGGAMLLCSHEMLAIQSFCHHCLLLDRGRLIMEGSPVETIARHQQLCREREDRMTDSSPSTKTLVDPVKLDQHCKIKSISVHAVSGLTTITPGTDVDVEISVIVHDEIKGIACGIEIGLGDQVALATLTGGYPAGSFNLKPPQTFLQCRIRNLPLVPGNYDIRVALTIADSTAVVATYGYSNPALPLTVETPSNELSNVMHYRNNLIYMTAKWQVLEPAMELPEIDLSGYEPSE